MSTIPELVARLAEQMAELWNDRHDRAKSVFSRQTFAQFADECASIAAEARATERGHGDDLSPPTSHADLLEMGQAMTGGDTSDMIDPTPALADHVEIVRIPPGAIVSTAECDYVYDRRSLRWEVRQGDPPIGHPLDSETEALCDLACRLAARIAQQGEELARFRALAERARRKYAVDTGNCSRLEWRLAGLAKGPR